MHTRLIWAAGALPLANLLHALAPAPDHHQEAVAGPIMGTILTVSAIAAFVGLLRRRSWGPMLAAVTGIATIIGFALFHALPFQTEVTEPYWGDGVTNAPQVLSLVAVVATAAWLATEASATLQARRGKVDVAQA
jgi:hypothetical protein